jgi:hypothetical protein
MARGATDSAVLFSFFFFFGFFWWCFLFFFFGDVYFATYGIFVPFVFVAVPCWGGTVLSTTQEIGEKETKPKQNKQSKSLGLQLSVGNVLQFSEAVNAQFGIGQKVKVQLRKMGLNQRPGSPKAVARQSENVHFAH